MTNSANPAKFNMIAQQIRPWEVLDERVLGVIDTVDRVNFVPEIYQGLAYADCQVPVCSGVKMFPPTLEGRMLQSLLIKQSDDILEIGTGCGFITTCLSLLGASVTSIDCNAEALGIAEANIAHQQRDNIELIEGNCFNYEFTKSFDVIAVTGSLTSIPDSLKDRVKTGGRLFAIVGQSPVMQAMLLTRLSDNEWSSESLFETCIPALTD